MNNKIITAHYRAELLRLTKKQGWYDAFDGSGPHPPTKCVMNKLQNGTQQNPVPDDEEQAYWDGYDEGSMAENGDKNPYALANVRANRPAAPADGPG